MLILDIELFNQQNFSTMVLHNLRTASRIFKRNKINTSINLIGFSIGLAVAFLIFSYVRHELSYDRYHANAENLYRAHIHLKLDGEEKEVPISANILGPTLKDNLPEVADYVRMFKSINSTPTLIIDEEKYLEPSFYFADSSLFDLFSIEMVRGLSEGMFTQPEDAVISEKTAEKYYGSIDVIGNTFRDSEGKNFVIKGVFRDFPGNAHMHPSFIASALASRIAEPLRWGDANFYTYILLNEGAEIEVVESKLARIMQEEMDEWMKKAGLRYEFLPITDIHLKSHTEFEMEASGDISQVYAFIAIAIFIVIIACINYMNLATSRSIERAREVGVRKMLGGIRGQLIRQFLTESFLLTLFSMILAAFLVALIAPYFNAFIQNPIDFSFMASTTAISLLAATWLGISLLAGLYPAFVLTAFSPKQVLKGSFKTSKSGVLIRKSTVVLQLVISTVLIIGAFIIHSQISYMSSQKLGFDKEHVLILQMQKEPAKESLEALKSTLLQHSNIVAVSRSSAYPSRNSGGSFIATEGMRDDENMLAWCWRVNEDITAAFGFELLAGKPFDHHTSLTEETEYIINETTMRALGWTLENCIGKRMEQGTSGHWKGYCYGVIKDFHVGSLKNKIEPIVMMQAGTYMNNFVVRLGSGDIRTTMSFVENEWSKSMPELAFDYHFLDQAFDKVYASEEKTLTLTAGFSLFAILIACLGIFGLSNYEVLARTKEIGVRKVLGASLFGVFGMVVKNFALLVLISFAIASGLAYWVMDSWLQEFAHRTTMQPIAFLLAGALTFVIVILSVSYQSIKAAFLNPVDSLKCE